jgi:hypothetical protein
MNESSKIPNFLADFLLFIALSNKQNMKSEIIQSKIYEARDQKVMLDFDLAMLYEVETRLLNQAVKRNIDLFPVDFMFRLYKKEWEFMSSQIVMTPTGKRPKSVLPLVFTEHGVIMLANILKSKKARQTSIALVRAFITLKRFILNYDYLSEKLTELESKYNKQFNDVYEVINFLLTKDKEERAQKERKRIGFL